jgi:hypothetical protein
MKAADRDALFKVKTAVISLSRSPDVFIVLVFGVLSSVWIFRGFGIRSAISRF